MFKLRIFIIFNTLCICLGDNFGPYFNTSDEYVLEDAYIERPCEVFDRFCIRKYFKEHSHCKPVYGPVPDPLYRDQTVVHLAHANVTVIPIDFFITGLNGIIEEFYINKKTDNLVLAVEFTNVNASSDKVYGRYYRSTQEPLVARDYGYNAFKSLLLTIIIPNLKDLQFSRSEVFSYSNDAQPQLVFGPRLINPNYPVDPVIAVREILLTDTPFYIGAFIQYDICDFGVDLL